MKNLLLNAGAEVDTSNTASRRNAIITRTTDQRRSGLAAFQVVTPGTQTNEGISLLTDTGLNLDGAHVFNGGVWLKGSGTINVAAQAVYTDETLGTSTSKQATLTADWQWVALNTFTSNAGKTVGQVRLIVHTSGTEAVTFYVDDGRLYLPFTRKVFPMTTIDTPFIRPITIGRG